MGCYPEDVELKLRGSVWQELSDISRITDLKFSQRGRFFGLILKVVWKSASWPGQQAGFTARDGGVVKAFHPVYF